MTSTYGSYLRVLPMDLPMAPTYGAYPPSTVTLSTESCRFFPRRTTFTVCHSLSLSFWPTTSISGPLPGGREGQVMVSSGPGRRGGPRPGGGVNQAHRGAPCHHCHESLTLTLRGDLCGPLGFCWVAFRLWRFVYYAHRRIPKRMHQCCSKSFATDLSSIN